MEGRVEAAGVEEFVLDSLRMLAERDDVGVDARLDAFDIDSLALVEFMQIVQETYGVRLKPTDFEGVETVRDLLDVVVARVT